MSPHLIGFLLIIGCNIALGLNPPLAKLVYSHGGNPETVVAMRYLIGIPILTLFLIISRQKLKFATFRSLPAWVVGLGWTVTSVGYLSSVFFIPVSLAVLLFFTFPIVVTLIDIALGKVGNNLFTLCVVACAFVGLTFVLAPAFDQLDWRGLVLAFVGGLGTATAILVTNHKAQDLDRLSLAMVVLLTGAIIVAPVAILRDALILPATISGNLYLLTAASLNAVALIMMFSAIKRIGSTQTALFMNLEPLVTISVALLFLNEVLSPLQIAGVLVILSVLFASSLRSK